MCNEMHGIFDAHGFFRGLVANEETQIFCFSRKAVNMPEKFSDKVLSENRKTCV